MFIFGIHRVACFVAVHAVFRALRGGFLRCARGFCRIIANFAAMTEANEHTALRRAEQAALLPFAPGVYLVSDRTGKIIYVGKAKSLRSG